jgi:hypothetical protein
VSRSDPWEPQDPPHLHTFFFRVLGDEKQTTGSDKGETVRYRKHVSDPARFTRIVQGNAIRSDKKPLAVVTSPDRKTLKANDNDDDFARKGNVESVVQRLSGLLYSGISCDHDCSPVLGSCFTKKRRDRRKKEGVMEDLNEKSVCKYRERFFKREKCLQKQREVL